MFNATPEGWLERRLAGGVGSREDGPWVSATTSEQRSYRQSDVPEILEWQIIVADEFSAHLLP